MFFIINKEVETVQNIQSCLFSFKQLNCDFINYRDTSGTHTCVSLRLSVCNIAEVMGIFNDDHVFGDPPPSLVIELSWRRWNHERC